MIYWVLKNFVLGPVLKVLFRPWTKGLDNLPVEGPAVLASNHLSFSDSIFMPLMVPRPVVFLAKSDYFTGRGSRAPDGGLLQADKPAPHGSLRRGGLGRLPANRC